MGCNIMHYERMFAVRGERHNLIFKLHLKIVFNNQDLIFPLGFHVYAHTYHTCEGTNEAGRGRQIPRSCCELPDEGAKN